MSKLLATTALASIAFAAAMVAPGAQAQTIERAKLSDGDLSCAQLYSEVKMMELVASSAMAAPAAAPAAPASPSTLAANTAANDAAAAAGGQMLNALVQQGGARGGLGGLLGGLMSAVQQAPAGGVNQAQLNQLAQAAQQGGQYQNAQAQAMALAAQLASQQAGGTAAVNAQQVNALQALAQTKGVGGANAAGVANLLGGLFSSAAAAPAPQAAQPMVVLAPAGNSALAQQAGARKEHVTGLFVAKGCKLSDVQR